MSSRKNFLTPYPVVGGNSGVAADMSAASITSSVTNIAYLDDIGVQFSWTGSPVGTFQIQVSADYQQDANGNVQNAGNWVPLILSYWNGTAFVTGSTIPATVGSPIYLDLSLLSAPWMRSVYTRSSGSGTLLATVVAKSVS